MKQILFFVCVFFWVPLWGQVPEFEWVKHIEGEGGGIGRAIATDNSGNVYVTGSFSYTADFDPGVNTYNLTSMSTPDYVSRDIFIAKYSTDGQLIWALSFGDVEYDYGQSIETDTFGNVYVSGYFEGIVDFDPGTDVHNLSSPFSNGDHFILKLDTDGDFLWAKKMEGFGGGNEFAIDESGNVYLTGRFDETVDFDMGPDIYNLSATGTKDAFILKLDSDGDFEWVKRMGGDDYTFGDAIMIDTAGNIYTVGSFGGTVDFDSGLNEAWVTAIGLRDGFVLKLDSNGDFIWLKNVGDTYWTNMSSVVVDELGAVYTLGGFRETVDFDPGSDVYQLTSAGEADIFILKLDIEGNFIWAKSFGGESLDGGGNLILDKNSNVYINGMFHGILEFDQGTNIQSLSSPSIAVRNGFILKLDKHGTPLWAGSFYGNQNNEIFSIVLDQWNNIFSTGYFKGTADFNPDTANYELTATEGSNDILIHKVSQPCNANLSINTNNNTFAICSQESIDLSAVLPSYNEEVSYSWNTGDTTNTILITPDSTTSYAVSVSYEYNDMLCTFTDSVEIVVLEIPDTTYLNFTTCDSMEVGISEILYPAQNGCDSLVVAESIFLPLPATPVVPTDIIITEDAPPLQISIAEVPGASSYLWEVPPTVQILSGSNTNSITIDWDDQLLMDSVCVSAINECGSSPAACLEVMVDITDATKNIQSKGFRIFPNPTEDVLNIVFDETMWYEVVLYNALSQEVERLNAAQGHSQLSVNELPNGTYWLNIICDQNAQMSDSHWHPIIVMDKK